MGAEWVVVRKLDSEGREVTAYPGRVVARTPASVVLDTRWERPPLDLGYVVLEPGDRWRERFYADRWYNVFEIHAADGRLKGWYCNICRPARITETEVSAEDLALDLWVDSGGRVMELDKEEFAALPLAAGERAAGLAALAWLREQAAQGLEPFVPETEEGMGEPLEAVVGRLLRERGLKLAVAESCTGGLISHRITDVPGSSDYYPGSVTAYANEVKEALLGVRHDTLCRHGAVSEETAREMAEGVRRVLGADLGLAVTGVAGPTGGTPEKPVGLVYIALATPDGEWVERHVWKGDRWANKAASAEAALDLVRRYLEGELGGHRDAGTGRRGDVGGSALLL